MMRIPPLTASMLLTTLYWITCSERAWAADKGLAAPVSVRLGSGGRALLPVVVSGQASERTRASAKTLADYLGRISGATFTVEAGNGETGIAIGCPGDFPSLKLHAAWDAKDASQRQDYLLRTHDKGVHVIGATEGAVEYAVWDVLYRLGHRQFFPGPTWEVIPRAAELALAVDVRAHPSFLSRDIGYGLGVWDATEQRTYDTWCTRNRILAKGDQPLRWWMASG